MSDPWSVEVVRFGGEARVVFVVSPQRFAILETEDDAEAVEDCRLVADMFRKALARIGVRAGIAVHPSHLPTVVDLLEDEVAALRKVAEAARRVIADARDEDREDMRDSVDEQLIEELRASLEAVPSSSSNLPGIPDGSTPSGSEAGRG